MKRLFLILVFYIFSQTSTFANERDVRLNQLFNELKVNKAKIASIVEQEIWKIWRPAGDACPRAMARAGLTAPRTSTSRRLM